MARLRREAHTRMLGNRLCSHPVELDCRMESACETCGFFHTGTDFLPSNSPNCSPSSPTGSPSSQRRTLGDRLTRYVGHDALGVDELRNDLQRFVFLLGVRDGAQTLPRTHTMITHDRGQHPYFDRITRTAPNGYACEASGGVRLRTLSSSPTRRRLRVITQPNSMWSRSSRQSTRAEEP